MSVTAAPGFVAAGTSCGIKSDGRPDLALVATVDHRPVPAAAVFTSNRVRAAPVQVSAAHLARAGTAAAVVLNSGNANAATGERGRGDARCMARAVAAALGCAEHDVVVCSTGLIGVPLPIAAIEAGIARGSRELACGSRAGEAAADAIRTTDTVSKQAVAEVPALGVTVGGMGKGAAMLAPALATMLAVLTTDAAIAPPTLRQALRHAVDETFNRLCVDGSTSTNDTVVVLANGRGDHDPVTGPGPALDALTGAFTQVCDDLAQQMAADAEGATKLATIEVRGARTPGDARRAAHAVARSQLVQCSLNGQDPYWGRVLAELGASGADLDPEAVDIAYQGITVCRAGVAAPHDTVALRALMREREITICCDLHLGTGEARVRFTDLSHAYVDENRGTS